ncbi:regulatory protein RecX [Myxococcaceae bacterium GXIMD 01537]
MVPEEDGPEAVTRATDACLRLLSARGRSQHELRAALQRKGFSERVCEAALARLAGFGYLDDARFARERAASLLRRGRLGPEGVLRRLEAHGLEGEAAREALAGAQGEVGFDAEAAARRVLEQRRLAGRELTPRERARAGRLLSSRGFDADVIHRLLGEASLEVSESDD